MTWYTSVSNWLLGKLPASPTAVVATVPIGAGVPLTAGNVRDALSGLPALGIALSDIVRGTATMSDVEVIGEDVLTVASLADPALAPVLSVASALLPYALNFIASGAIKPDPNPIQDAQTTRNFNSGDPAARLNE